MSDSSHYAKAGVSIDAQDEAIARIRPHVQATFTEGVKSDLGRFGGLFQMPAGLDDPILFSSTDGVGTKLKIAFMTGVHDTVGYDLVSHCVSDILTQGARPLFFLDYMAMHACRPEVVEAVVAGMARACREMGCALIGGELAELREMYGEGEYDLAGFVVGVVERKKILDGATIAPGDVLLGLPSTGLHTNGYSLARRIVFDEMGLAPDDPSPGRRDECRLRHAPEPPTLPRHPGPLPGRRRHQGAGPHHRRRPHRQRPPGAAPETHAVIRRSAWEVPALFRLLQERGGVSEEEMLRVFNMGVGMVAVVAPDRAEAVASDFAGRGDTVYRLGEIRSGGGPVVYE